MNREIKFRAFVNKKMDYNPVVSDGTDGGETSSVRLNSAIECSEYTLMQYTGLKDKNGVEIYEGDIVKCASSYGCPHEVVWMDYVPNQNLGGSPGFYLSGLSSGYSFTGQEEIIGNIHQNPELLK